MFSDWLCSFIVRCPRTSLFLRKDREFSGLGKTLQAPQIRHCGGHALDHLQRHFLRLHIRRCACMDEGRCPHHQGEDNLLAIQLPCLIEADAKAAVLPHPLKITPEQIAFPCATILYRYSRRKCVCDVTRPMPFAQALPVAQSQTAFVADVPIAQVHIRMQQGVWAFFDAGRGLSWLAAKSRSACG